MSDMLNRLRELRKTKLSLSQEEFGKLIGLSKSNISNIEIGRVELTDRNISMICDVFNVNEVWLRTGEGGEDNIFKKISDEDAYSLNLGKLTVAENEFIKNTVKYLANAEPEKLKIIEEFMMTCLGVSKKEKE